MRGEAGQGRPQRGAACSESVTFLSVFSRGARAAVSVGRASVLGPLGACGAKTQLFGFLRRARRDAEAAGVHSRPCPWTLAGDTSLVSRGRDPLRCVTTRGRSWPCELEHTSYRVRVPCLSAFGDA